MQRDDKTCFPSKNIFKDDFCTQLLENAFFYNVISPEKQLFLSWTRKPQNYYTELLKLYVQGFSPELSGGHFLRIECETNNLAILCFEIPFKREAFHFNHFGTFRELTFKQARN